MSFGTEIVEAAVNRITIPVTSSEIAEQLKESLERGAVFTALNELAKEGRIKKCDKAPIPAVLRSAGSPKEAWTYMAADPADQFVPVPEDEWPGDIAAPLPVLSQDAVQDTDPVISEILREGERCCRASIHDAAILAQRLLAGVPFIRDRMPMYADVIGQAAAALTERA